MKLLNKLLYIIIITYTYKTPIIRIFIIHNALFFQCPICYSIYKTYKFKFSACINSDVLH